MKNIYEILKSFGLAVPDDKKEEFDKMLNENYKIKKGVFDYDKNRIEHFTKINGKGGY